MLWFLARTGSPPRNGGYKSLFAFWSGGAGSLGGVTPPSPELTYVNNSGFYTPRHERIGRPLPDFELPVLPPLIARISSGQGGQSVTATFYLSIRAALLSDGAFELSFAEGSFSVPAEIEIKQAQSSRLDAKLKVFGGARSAQSMHSVISTFGNELSFVGKSGGEALVTPSYAGEETPDAFFQAIDRET